MTDYIIIVAGGKGLRMGSDIPKQFLPIEGQPVLMRTIAASMSMLPDWASSSCCPPVSKPTGRNSATTISLIFLAPSLMAGKPVSTL